MSLEERDNWGKRGNTECLPSLGASWVWRRRLTITVHWWSCFCLLVNGTASGIFFAKYTWEQIPLLAPVPSLSQKFLSPDSHLCEEVPLLYSIWQKTPKVP